MVCLYESPEASEMYLAVIQPSDIATTDRTKVLINECFPVGFGICTVCWPCHDSTAARGPIKQLPCLE